LSVCAAFEHKWRGNGCFRDAVHSYLQDYCLRPSQFPCLIARLDLISERQGDLSFGREEGLKEFLRIENLENRKEILKIPRKLSSLNAEEEKNAPAAAPDAQADAAPTDAQADAPASPPQDPSSPESNPAREGSLDVIFPDAADRYIHHARRSIASSSSSDEAQEVRNDGLRRSKRKRKPKKTKLPGEKSSSDPFEFPPKRRKLQDSIPSPSYLPS